ncbi:MULTISPECIES: GntR family transcriptional regulator [unclassified Bradyrhizobium]
MGTRQTYEALRDQILGRLYGADGLLSSSRALAGELGVSRGTVPVAYEQLAAEGSLRSATAPARALHKLLSSGGACALRRGRRHGRRGYRYTASD